MVCQVNFYTGGLGVACWPLVPKFAGSNPAEAVGFFKDEEILSTSSFGGEVKPFVPCHIYAACKRSLKKAWKSLLQAKFVGHFSPNSFTLRYYDLWRRADVGVPGGEGWNV
jgi:hypothetical protein